MKPAEDAGRTEPMEECYLLQKVTLIEWLTKYGDKEAFLLKRQDFGKTDDNKEPFVDVGPQLIASPACGSASR